MGSSRCVLLRPTPRLAEQVLSADASRQVLWHSFASNCAVAGVDQRVTNEWMGHQTEEMVRRYRHLFPEQQRQAIDKVFG